MRSILIFAFLIYAFNGFASPTYAIVKGKRPGDGKSKNIVNSKKLSKSIREIKKLKKGLKRKTKEAEKATKKARKAAKEAEKATKKVKQTLDSVLTAASDKKASDDRSMTPDQLVAQAQEFIRLRVDTMDVVENDISGEARLNEVAKAVANIEFAEPEVSKDPKDAILKTSIKEEPSNTENTPTGGRVFPANIKPLTEQNIKIKGGKEGLIALMMSAGFTEQNSHKFVDKTWATLTERISESIPSRIHLVKVERRSDLDSLRKDIVKNQLEKQQKARALIDQIKKISGAVKLQRLMYHIIDLASAHIRNPDLNIIEIDNPAEIDSLLSELEISNDDIEKIRNMRFDTPSSELETIVERSIGSFTYKLNMRAEKIIKSIPMNRRQLLLSLANSDHTERDPNADGAIKFKISRTGNSPEIDSELLARAVLRKLGVDGNDLQTTIIKNIMNGNYEKSKSNIQMQLDYLDTLDQTSGE